MNSPKIKKIAYLSFGLILVLVFSTFLIANNLRDPKFSGPRIEFKVDRLNLGDVKAGPKVEGEFDFTNTGKSKLVIQNIQPSCGCTGVIADEKKEFEPGESGKIKFTFNTEGRLGVNEKNITVNTNDGVTPTKTVTFTCSVNP